MLIARNNTIIKFLLFKMKYIIDGVVYLIIDIFNYFVMPMH